MILFLLSTAVRGLLGALSVLAGLLPVRATTGFGAVFGGIWFRLRGPRVERVRAQLGAAYPDWTEDALGVETRRVFEHLGESLAELILLRTRHRETLIARVDIEGMEHLEAARRESPTGGVLLLTAHCGNWELCGVRLAREGVPLTAMERGFASSELESVLRDIRLGPVSRRDDYTFLKLGKAGFAFMRALTEGRSVFVLLDQNVRRGECGFAPFFGRPASIRPGPLRLAARRGVPIVPIFASRLSAGGRHRIEVGPALALDRSDPIEDPAREARNLSLLTGTIETAIRRNPSQWIWTHRRWRRQPDTLNQPPGA